MSKVMKVNCDSDLNYLEVGDEITLSSLSGYGAYEYYWDVYELDFYPGHTHSRSTVNYISKDYLIVDAWLLLSLNSRL